MVSCKINYCRMKGIVIDYSGDARVGGQYGFGLYLGYVKVITNGG